MTVAEPPATPTTLRRSETTPQSSWRPEKLLSDVDLDHYASQHLHDFSHQALSYSYAGLDAVEQWTSFLLDAAHGFLRTLLPEHFERLSATRLAIADAKALLLAERDAPISSKASKVDVKAPISPQDVTARAHQLLAERSPAPSLLGALVLNVHFDAPDAGDGCTFKPDVYEGHLLFEEGHQARHHLDPAMWQTIGGTFMVSCSKETVHKILKPLQLTIFAAIQLKLEAHWLRDILCVRTAPPVSTQVQQPEEKAPDEAILPRPRLFMSDTISTTASLQLKPTRSNLWGLLLGKGEEEKPEGSPWRQRFRQSISKGLKKRRLRRTSTQNEEWLVVETAAPVKARPPLPSRPSLLKTMFERTSTTPAAVSSTSAKLKPSPKKQMLEPASLKPPSAENGHDEPEGRYAKVIARMESTVLSTSTAVRFGPPHLLERLRLQEIQDERVEEQHAPEKRPTALRQRSFPTVDAENLANSFAESSRAPTPHASISKHSGKMAADARAAFASLTANNASLSGMMRHQSLQYLIGRKLSGYKAGDAACQVLRNETVAYYHSALHESDPAWTSDERIGEWVARHARAAKRSCSASGCDKPIDEHVTTYLHNDSRLELRLSRADAKTPFEMEREITTWASCTTCDQIVRPTILSAATALMSSSKLLEMIFYDSKMVPDDDTTCSHMLDSHFSVVRHFRYRDTVISLQHSPVNLYELRMPTPLADDARVDDPPSPPHLAQSKEKDDLRQEVRAFTSSLIERIDAIESVLKSRAGDVQVLGALQKLKAAHLDADPRLLKIVRETSLDALNDARFACRQSYNSTLEQLAILEHDALDKRERAHLSRVALSLPSFVQPGHHALPAGNAIVAREDEPSSLIAFAISATLFRQEMANIMAELTDAHPAPWLDSSPPTSVDSVLPQPSTISGVRTDSFSQSVSIERTESLRQAKSLLSLGQRSPTATLAARFQRIVSDPVGKEAEVTVAEVTSPLSAEKRDDSALLESLLVSKETTPMTRKTSSIDPNKVPKLITALATPNKRAVPDLTASSPQTVFAPSMQTTPKASILALNKGREADWDMLQHDEDLDDMPLDAHELSVPLKHQPSNQSLTSQKSGASSINPPDSARSSVLSTLWTTATWRGEKSGNGIVRSTSVRKLARSEDRKRHLKYVFRDGEKRFTVTAWDAARFSKLRRQCGIREQTFIESLSRCSKWNTTGGKSKSAFFMTGDKRFVLKQMLDAWTGSERDSMLAFSTDYFRYFQATSSQRPSLIAKLFGVFSVHIKDEKSGDERKLDLVVMENLFATHAVSHTFDLKGIAARVSKSAAEDSVQWDSAWIRAWSNVVLVHAYSKAVITAALKNDADWLAKCGIMDYSALLGISDEEHALILGIIDVLGSFNLAKYIEHRAKSALRSGETTVVPPAEYAERFRRALASYIVAVPEKWTSCAAIESRRPTLPCPL